MEYESQRIQFDPRNIHYTKRIVPPSLYKQCATPPRRCQVFWATPLQEAYLAQTHFRKTETTRNHPHENVLVTRTQVKTLYKQQTSHIYIYIYIYIYKTILKPIWTYEMQLWGMASTSNIEILERFQSKALLMIAENCTYRFGQNSWKQRPHERHG
jgi:hypothetical protein